MESNRGNKVGSWWLPLFLSLLCFMIPGHAAYSHSEGKHGFSDETILREKGKVPLVKGLYSLDYFVTTKSDMARAYFNQGLVLTYGFDHADAEVSFLEAAKLDPECAMCYWGAAFVLGPNINAPMDNEAVPKAYEYSRKALALMDKASDREQALIQALAKRYGQEPVTDRSSLDRRFADAMREVCSRYPEDPTIAVLYAEALMDLHPWDYWTVDGKPQAWTPAIESILVKVMADHPRHPHAHHLYIHLLENSPFPEKTVRSADRIKDLVPASGHLVHMAGHAYYAAGLYHDCSEINERALEVDKLLTSSFHTQGFYQLAYVPHVLHFLLASYIMEGRSEDALRAARTLAGSVDPSKMRQPGMGFLQHYYVAPYTTLVRFRLWEDILNESSPGEDLLYPRAMWHYARGMAFARMERIEEAKGELPMLKIIAGKPELETVTVWDLNKVSSLLDIAVAVLAGEISASQGEYDAAIAHLEQGIALEEALTYDEPPPWYFPVRQSLGAVLLAAGRPAKAESVYRTDLKKNSENPWSLHGLAVSLRAQGKTDLAMDAEQRFRRAWARADREMHLP
ncbi:MAG: hypothetical protein WBX49_11820 [Candidatus Deferrimicrobiaceae bacterium]